MLTLSVFMQQVKCRHVTRHAHEGLLWLGHILQRVLFESAFIYDVKAAIINYLFIFAHSVLHMARNYRQHAMRCTHFLEKQLRDYRKYRMIQVEMLPCPAYLKLLWAHTSCCNTNAFLSHFIK